MRELIDLYFKNHTIVTHHIDSFNSFICSPDNPNSRMQQIVDDLRDPSDDSQRGVITLDPTKTDSRDIKIRIGRPRRDDGLVDVNAPQTIRVDRPKVIEANGFEHDINPMEARIRNLNYMSSVYVKFEVTVDGQPVPLDGNGWVKIGCLPMMVKSKGCNLHKAFLESPERLDRRLTDEEYEAELIKLGEDPREPGGYFIIGGTERLLITLEDLAPNRVMCEMNARYNTETEVAKIFSQKEGYRALTQVEKKNNGILMVSVPAATQEIPLVTLMRALGMDTDEEIYNAIVNDERMSNIVLTNLEDSRDKETKTQNGTQLTKGFSTTEDAITYLERNFAAGQAKEYRTKKVEAILDRSLLPHLGDTSADRMKKAIFLGRMARSVLEMAIGDRQPDDKDHYANKRLKLSGDLMEDLFRTSFASLMKDLKYQLERNMGRKKSELNINSSIRPDMFTHKLLHALATGNWVGGRAGVSQLLDRTSNLSAMSHLRRITSSLTRSQPHFEARDLHPTQWGRLCPSETPEGQNCGLVKNAALIINVSSAVPDHVVLEALNGFGLVPVEEGLTKVFVNGDLVGCHADPKRLVEQVREGRRSGVINGNINIRNDEEMAEVVINSDDGRLRRPLLVMRDGRTLLNREHVEGMREGRITWDDLVTYGVMEWIDAEEEEDALVLVKPYELPARCPCCGHALSETDVDWMNVGADDSNVKATLKCNWCHESFDVDSATSTEIGSRYTHMEVDPMIIIGVAAGIVPYPEHNSAPRITMGAAMAKQALGISCSNYRMRPDTRGHLMHYPQVPMLQTQTMKYIGYRYRPAGQNFCIAVMCFHGYNIEDAIIMNKSSVQRGLGRTTFMRSYRSEERKYPGGPDLKDVFQIPGADVQGVRPDEAYSCLDEDGLIYPEAKVSGSAVLIGKTSPPRFMDEEEVDYMSAQKRRETSVTVRAGESGYVDSVLLTESDNGLRLVRVKVRDERVPELGDKFCSRFGQKGVVGRLVDQADMPFTADGVTPDIVVNPHGIPSRMTIGHVLEMIAGKVGSFEGRVIDGTAFSGESEDSIRDGLVRNGFARTGKEMLFDGRTGHMVQTDVYTGVIFYEKLHHMVSGKMHVRSRGPIQILTRQPTEGRSRQGGLRFGEMERDCLIGHGVAMVIKDRLLDESDGTMQYVCGNPDCGHIAVLTANGQLYCPVCKNNSAIHQVQTSYAFKLLTDELMSMGVAMRLRTEDLS